MHALHQRFNLKSKRRKLNSIFAHFMHFSFTSSAMESFSHPDNMICNVKSFVHLQLCARRTPFIRDEVLNTRNKPHNLQLIVPVIRDGVQSNEISFVTTKRIELCKYHQLVFMQTCFNRAAPWLQCIWAKIWFCVWMCVCLCVSVWTFGAHFRSNFSHFEINFEVLHSKPKVFWFIMMSLKLWYDYFAKWNGNVPNTRNATALGNAVSCEFIFNEFHASNDNFIMIFPTSVVVICNTRTVYAMITAQNLHRPQSEGSLLCYTQLSYEHFKMIRSILHVTDFSSFICKLVR